MRGTRVLVAFASKSGSTAEIARIIGSELALSGIEPDVLSVEQDIDLERYDAVILGSAIYAWSWQKDAVRFAKQNSDRLRKMPVWLFSSGPLDWSAEDGDMRPVRSARKVSELVGAREHVTFGGKLPADAKGLIARQALSKEERGDFRDFGRIRAWADELAKKIPVIAGKTAVAQVHS